MRLWSIHPVYLDARGLVTLWREALLAQNVLLGKTKGYRNHPQLIRFRDSADPVGAIGAYLRHVAVEADARQYRFNRKKIYNSESFTATLPVTNGQTAYEFRHLLNKLQKRDPERYNRHRGQSNIELHPLFRKVGGEVEAWEKRQA